jgi:hypothetical protein
MFAGFAYGAERCAECVMTVTVMSNVDNSVITVPWDASEAMTYSYYVDSHVLEGEQFICCNRIPPSCCNFWSDDDSLYCDALGPGRRSEFTNEACPLAPWPCRYKLAESGRAEDVELHAGYDTRAEDLWTTVSGTLVLAFLMMVCHPLFWKVVGDLLNKIAELLVQKYFATVTLAKVKKIQEDLEEEERRRAKKASRR